ncbi:hypothetical protein ACVRWQ_03710 [Streptococcus phocae subsp. salmonis]|uniref:hypothetical protein n=1 Tax=Streptococcus phocae TaxID=119224 RepID=UPI00068CF93C|nr:hypothetical protein [Streptococcus phocae]
MTTSILSIMSSIEQEAQRVYDSYDVQKKDLAAQRQRELEELAKHYEQETQQLVMDKEALLAQHKKQLTQDVEQTIEQQTASIQSLLASKKADLITQMVDKVVETYGH